MFFSNLNPLLATILLSGLLFTSCNDSTTENTEVPPFDIEGVNPDSSNMTPLDKFHAVAEARKEAGENTPRDHEFLARLLPDTLPELSLHLDEGNTFKNDDFAYSEATCIFYKDEDGEEYIKIQVSDYIADPTFFENVIDRYNAADGVKIDHVIEKKLPNEGGEKALVWSEIDTRMEVARVYAGVDYRYYIMIEGSKQTSTNGMIEVWRGLDYQRLLK